MDDEKYDEIAEGCGIAITGLLIGLFMIFLVLVCTIPVSWFAMVLIGALGFSEWGFLWYYAIFTGLALLRYYFVRR